MVFLCFFIIFLPRTKSYPILPTELFPQEYDFPEQGDFVHIPGDQQHEILLDDESARLVDHVSEDGILYEDEDTEAQETNNSIEEILLDDGSSRFFSRIGDSGLLYDELTVEGELVDEFEAGSGEEPPIVVYKGDEE